ncbi:hypothetical protein W822_22465 [Advenella kashmirensis W13003]|uniref:Uncharacterized protein n=1 Tax=Advenella kashmirensis W13003 TaxID=1424334 RepID=V8QMM6_9BURK|nr:hypothetical protein W822_22465 [Advenella kashmirensis W13003]
MRTLHARLFRESIRFLHTRKGCKNLTLSLFMALGSTSDGCSTTLQILSCSGYGVASSQAE